jgi:hypothetical protein
MSDPAVVTIDPLRPKRLFHLREGNDAGVLDLEALGAEIARRFPAGIRRILFVAVPQIAEEHFVFDAARKRRYPGFPPYGPAVLVAMVEAGGIQADIVDLHLAVLDHARSCEQPEQFSYAVWQGVLAERIAAFRPDVVGLSCMFNMGHGPLKQVASFLGANFPALPVIAGGVHVSLTPTMVLEDIPEISFALLNEGENVLQRFLDVANGRASARELASIAARLPAPDRIVVHGKRDAPTQLVHSPDYKALPIDRYSRVGRIGAYTFLRSDEAVAATVLSRRGCRAQCTFCSVRSVNGEGVRVRDHVAVVDEIEHLKRRYGVSHIMWLDDDLFYDRDDAIALFDEMAARKLGVTWDASNGIIASCLNEPLLDACVRSGCVGFNIGIESGNREILAHMRKPGSVERYLGAAELLARYPGIFTKGFLILGYPTETIAAVQDSVNLSLAMDLDWYPSQILTPMPGTPVHQLMLDQDASSAGPADALGRSTKLGEGRTFSIGATGSIAKRERSEREQARPFSNPFDGPHDRIPAREELEDLWIVVDYRINYQPILSQPDPRKLEKKRLMLAEICDRMTSDNPLGNLFLAICELRLGDLAGARLHVDRAAEHLQASAFWRLRFEVLRIDEVLRDTQRRLSLAA